MEVSKKNFPLPDRNTNEKDPTEILVLRVYLVVQFAYRNVYYYARQQSLREEIFLHSVHLSLLMNYEMAVTFVADRKTNMGQLLTNIFKAPLSFAY